MEKNVHPITPLFKTSSLFSAHGLNENKIVAAQRPNLSIPLYARYLCSRAHLV